MFVTTLQQLSDDSWVAFATDERGNILTTIEIHKRVLLGKPCFVIDRYSVSPRMVEDIAKAVGDALDLQIAREAAMHGVVSVLLVTPEGLRGDGGPIYERKVVSLHHLDEVTPSKATQYVN